MLTQNNRDVLLHLSLNNKVIGPATAFKLLRHLHNELFPDVLHAGWMEVIEHHHLMDMSVLYSYSSADFVKKVGLSEKLATSIVEWLASRVRLDDELAKAQHYGIKIITILDTAYPEILKQITHPPLILYLEGSLPAPAVKCMGIVGSRKATDYANTVLKNMIPDLLAQEWCIVSGGALGADTMAHTITLDNGGTTVAVLGSGLLHPYPDVNIPLFRRIVQSGGGVLSIFPLMEEPERHNFPARNRVIAGLSLGCLVVQAAAKSGALITASCALEQGRQVFAVPGMIYDELSAGCHQLIKQGAKLVNTVTDILEEFGTVYQQSSLIRPAVRTTFDEHDMTSASPVAGQAQPINNDDPATALLMGCLQEPASLDELLDKTGFQVSDLQDRLFSLQLDGRVRQTFVGSWERVL